ncbi:ATP-binding protein [Paenibacillus sp. TAF43_2]
MSTPKKKKNELNKFPFGLVDVSPNVKIVASLEYSSFTSTSAICEFIDNALDANANKIFIYIQQIEQGKFLLTIADDGSGMDPYELQESLRLASN